ncbi:hypothetical protein M8J76_010889 [Diaphorina citri]|nr:hypothetical protein M8J75_005166 [Diaphorina citri]KAI5723784.1 hypothetical protein M8J76_010889 [Diaphorina citri]
MKDLKCVCFVVLVFLNVYWVTCAPVVEIEDELNLDSSKPAIENTDSTTTIEKKEMDEKASENVKEPEAKETKTEESKEPSSDNDKEEIKDGKEDLKVEEAEVPNKEADKGNPKEDPENEKLCEELCSSCDGSENVFDIAEPSCFCKVTTVKSVKCLEHKVTEDFLMKVIAYVETDPKSDEEKLVAQYLKEREELSLNRNRRCCGHVGASNPRSFTERQLGAGQYDVRQSNDEEEGDTNGDILGSKKIDAGAYEELWRKALRAEETSRERSEEEDDDDPPEVTEKSTPVKRNKLAENRRIYKYEPPANYKSLLGQKAQETADEQPANQDEITPRKEKYLGSAKLLKSYEEFKAKSRKQFKANEDAKKEDKQESKDDAKGPITLSPSQQSMKELLTELKLAEGKRPNEVVQNVENSEPGKPQKYRSYKSKKDDEELLKSANESENKKLRAIARSRKQFKSDEESKKDDKGPITLSPSQQSMKELLTELKLAESKKQNEVIQNVENSELGKPQKYKSLDDMLYERELKKQKFLSSIREKYAKLPQEEEEESLEVPVKTKSEKSDKKRYMVESHEDEEELEEKIYNNSRDKLKAAIEELSEKYGKASKKYKSNQKMEQDLGDSDKTSKKLKYPKSEILGQKSVKDEIQARKPIVSPFIDRKNEDEREEKVSTPKYIYKYSKSSNGDTLKSKTSSKFGKNDEKIDIVPRKYKSDSAGKEYMDKDNELGGVSKSKESISSLISKIRAKYEKNERTDGLKSKENSKVGTYKQDNVGDTKVVGSQLLKYRDRLQSAKGMDKKIFTSRATKTKDYSEEDKNVSEDKESAAEGQKNVKSILKEKNLYEKPLSKYEKKKLIQTDEESSEKIPTVDKYLKAKYSGVKPSLIREPKKKGLNFRNIQNKKDINQSEETDRVEDEDLGDSDGRQEKVSAKSKYLQKKQELLQRIAEKENWKINSKSQQDKQNFPRESPNLTAARQLEFDEPEEITNEKETRVLTREEQNKLLEERIRELLDKNQHLYPGVKEETKKVIVIPSKELQIPKTKEEERKFLEEHLKDVLEKMRPYSTTADGVAKELPDDVTIEYDSSSSKPLTLKEKIEQNRSERLASTQSLKSLEPKQRKANRLESTQMISNEHEPSDLTEDKEIVAPFKEAPIKLSLKERIEQRKAERQNALAGNKLETDSKRNVENSANNESPIVSSQHKNEDASIKTIMDQNPQKHCEKCMEYVNHMSSLQKEQMLGKPYSTRSIPSSENQNTVDQSAQEKFLNCRCHEDQNGGGTPSTQSGSVPAQYVIPAQYVGATNGAVLGQPFNMQDVSKTLENIKTGIESSVKGANDKISTGFSDLKTNLQHQYEQASQKSLTENLKDASDKVSQKISDLHIKDTVVNGLSDMTHKVQEKYESVTQKGLEGNMKDISNVASNDADKMKTELHHWTDSIVSQPTPNAYASGARTVIPANQLRTKFVQAKYINPNNNLQGSPMSGNEFAPVSLVQN